jgi:hypothetical protein
LSLPPDPPLGEREILELVRARAERDLAVEGEQLTLLDVWLPMPSDTRQYVWTVMVKWERTNMPVADDAIYTADVKNGARVGDIFGPEW